MVKPGERTPDRRVAVATGIKEGQPCRCVEEGRRTQVVTCNVGGNRSSAVAASTRAARTKDRIRDPLRERMALP